jgi:arabinofuranosyltransferase
VEIGVPLAVLTWLGWCWLVRREFVLVDDAYIAFRYAANLAAGHGPVWNVGERVEGYTSPLWIVLLTPFARLGLDLAVPAVYASFAFAVATLVLLRHVVRRAAPNAGVVTRLLPGLLLASSPSWTHAGTSAMETSCFGFFVLGALFYLVRSREQPGQRRYATLFLCAAYLTRPEGLLVAAVALLVELASGQATLAARARRLAPIAVALTAVLTVHLAFRLHYYGYLLPNTFYAKVILGPVTRGRGTAHILSFLVAGGWVLLPGVVESFRRGPARVYLIHGHCLLFTYLAYLAFIGGDHPFWFRFYMPLLPLPLVATSFLVARIGATIRAQLPRCVPDRAALGLGALVTLGFAWLFNQTAYWFSEARDVIGAVHPGYSRAMHDIAAFFREEAPPGSLIATLPVGFVGYYVPRVRILDMWGLNDVHIAHLDVPPTFKFGHDKVDLGYVVLQKPDYWFLFRPVNSRVVPPIPGYDACWPSMHVQYAIYRRAYPLAPGDRHLGVPLGAARYLPPPPPCLPPRPS